MRSFESMTNAPHAPETQIGKITTRATEIRKNVPENQLPGVVADLEEYLKLRRLNEESFEDLPEKLREEIGACNPMDEFIDRVGNFDAWDDLSDQYGAHPGDVKPQWSISELEQLIEELRG